MQKPLLYTFRRCPYAIRARLAVWASGVVVEMREVDLRDKPQTMLEASPKGTVPVLQLPDGTVIDESLDIMRWALACNDPEGWLEGNGELPAGALELIAYNDGPFKQLLDCYKYAGRFPEHPAAHYRDEAGKFLGELNARLARHAFLLGARMSIADAALVPFVRQFAMVDKAWFASTAWHALNRWLDALLASAPFTAVMKKP